MRSLSVHHTVSRNFARDMCISRWLLFTSCWTCTSSHTTSRDYLNNWACTKISLLELATLCLIAFASKYTWRLLYSIVKFYHFLDSFCSIFCDVAISSCAGTSGRDSGFCTRRPLFRRFSWRLSSGKMQLKTYCFKHLQMTVVRTGHTFLGTAVLRARGVSHHKGILPSPTSRRSWKHLHHSLDLLTTQCTSLILLIVIKCATNLIFVMTLPICGKVGVHWARLPRV